MAELDLGLEHASNGTNGPCDNWLGDLARLDRLNDAVFLNTTNLTEEDDDLAVRVGLVTENVVDEGGTGVPVATNGNTLEHTVGRVGDDVIELVGHAAGLGDVRDGTRAVELGGNNVVHHATRVADLERTGPDATDGGGADDGDALLLGNVEDLPGTSLRHALGDDGDALDLWEFHQLHGGLEDGAGRGEVDDGVDVRVLANGLFDVLVDGQQRLAGSPVPAAAVSNAMAGGQGGRGLARTSC